MFRQVFDPENGLFRTVDQVADVMGLSVLWLICSLPLVTLGPATAALYYTVVKCVRQGERHTYGTFFSALRENFRTGAVLSVILVPVMGFLLWEWYALLVGVVQGGGGLTAPLAAFSVAMLLPLGVFFLIFPMIARFTHTAGSALSTAFRLCLGHLPRAALVAALNMALLLISVKWVLTVLPLVIAPGVGALLSSFLLEPLFRKYMPEEGPTEADEPEQ